MPVVIIGQSAFLFQMKISLISPRVSPQHDPNIVFIDMDTPPQTQNESPIWLEIVGDIAGLLTIGAIFIAAFVLL